MLVHDTAELTPREYEMLRRLVYEQSGINLGDSKAQLVRARLSKRLREGRFASFQDYYDVVCNDPTGQELVALLDAISTNTTHLFREETHFTFLRDTLTPLLGDHDWRRAHATLRIWSAGCSSGEEPHTLAIVLHDLLTGVNGVTYKILATDLSTRVLDKARAAVYRADQLSKVPAELRKRSFTAVDRRAGTWRLADALQQHLTFARLNLMSPSFPFRHGFDFIFCRNVMIYFDRPTQQTLVAKFTQHLRPGGHLLIGHSESLNAIDHKLDYVRPTIYRKPGAA